MAVCFVTIFLALGIRYSFGVFFVAILSEYPWGRGETAGAFSLVLVVHALCSPLSGTLVDRLGPRLFFPFGAALLTIGLVVASRTSALWHLYLSLGLIVAAGVNTLSHTPNMTVIAKWFVRKRGLASGMVMAGIGGGTLVLAPFIQFLIDKLGWRSALLVLAALVFSVIMPLTALFHRRSPQEVGQFPDGHEPDRPGPRPAKTKAAPAVRRTARIWTWKAALGSRVFWWTNVSSFTTGVVLQTIVVHQAARMVDAGYSQILAAALVGLVGLFGAVGGILGGYLSDRLGRVRAFSLGSASAFAGILCFLLVRSADSPYWLAGYVIGYGLGYGSLSPLQASFAGDVFSGPHLGGIIGTLSTGYGLGGALGVFLGGLFYDLTGGYTVPLLLVLLALVLGYGALWRADRLNQKTTS
ncbi:MAG: MFS transporter [Thermodesulfobacteriota bacterium]